MDIESAKVDTAHRAQMAIGACRLHLLLRASFISAVVTSQCGLRGCSTADGAVTADTAELVSV